MAITDSAVWVTNKCSAYQHHVPSPLPMAPCDLHQHNLLTAQLFRAWCWGFVLPQHMCIGLLLACMPAALLAKLMACLTVCQHIIDCNTGTAILALLPERPWTLQANHTCWTSTCAGTTADNVAAHGGRHVCYACASIHAALEVPKLWHVCMFAGKYNSRQLEYDVLQTT